MVENIKKDFNNSLKEIQENTDKKVEVLKEIHKTQPKQVMELNKTIQDLKMEIESIKESKRETTPKDRKPSKLTRRHRLKHHQQNTRDRRENLRWKRYHRKH